MTTYYQPLFDYMSNQHGVHLLESDMSEIINIVKQMKNKERIAILESEISRLKVANRDNIYRLEAIESHLAKQHKGANFSKLNSSEIPNSCDPFKPEAPECVADNGVGEKRAGMRIHTSNLDSPVQHDYTHLLPEGYEFCSEEDAEKWVKVEILKGYGNQSKLGRLIDGIFDVDNELHHCYRPIRPIQYKVTTHEITTAVPDPYMPDWSKAPEGTVAHAWDEDGKGFWYIVKKQENVFGFVAIESNLTLPADLDWRQSLRVKPSK
jgi:hypothetical protein